MSNSERLKHLLACLGEECGEVQQVVGKSLRFGIADCNPNTGVSNIDLLINEFHDAMAVYELIFEELGVSGHEFIYFENKKVDKKQKVEKYIEYAKNVGVYNDKNA